MSEKTEINAGQVVDLPLSKLLPDPDQPRKNFDEAAIQELAESLKHRVQVPLLVRSNGKGGKFIIHDGERRWRAAKLAKIKKLPVLLIDTSASDPDIRADQVAANSFREQLKPIEMARLLANLKSQHFASDNELAAYLEERGLPAKSPKQIRDLLALVELPDWAQKMIDAGQLEPTPAAKIKVAMRHAPALEAVKEYLERDIEWAGRATADDVGGALRHAFFETAIDLTRTEPWRSDPVHFDAKTACKGCEHLVNLNGEKYCLNREAFEKKNAEAKAAGLLPGGREPSEPPPSSEEREAQEAEEKAAKRTATLGEKARDYLHAYLVERLVRHMQGDAESHQIDITDELLAWHAMRHPGQDYYGGRAAVQRYESASEGKIKSLENLLNMADLAPAKLLAAIEIAHELKWRETQVLCHELWGRSIELVWSMDEDFLKLFRKAELVHLAVTHELLPPDGKAWEKMKLTELRTEILARAHQVRQPAILRDTYSEIKDPFEGWGNHY